MARHVLHMILVGALLLVACGDDDDASSPDNAQAETAPSAPYGTYVRQVSRQDLARTAAKRDEYGPTQEQPPAGRYRLVIAKGAAADVLKATDPGGFTVGMDLKATSGAIRLTSYVDPAKASFCGPEVPTQAAYRYEAGDSTLRLDPEAADPCADRDSILTGTWRRE